ncbi:hypothetical protein HQ865_16415 [Mucilaginibacter mali]|uniref:Lipocalin-like domain-containing protein n=1 Tax=Mucilaginibacter mali TaxID=2740462 RepID=A0A7D4TQC9_9SPHI|nr:hypothetical protein [Mucilaginibacter mali]QKJ31274.1 hypothetical protein HQ865_16415 [Mucilaginibacter mali]
MKKLCLFIACSLLVLASCKKKADEIDTSTASVNVALLTTKAWIISGNDANPATNPKGGTINYAPISACYTDDTYTFNTDGTMLVDNGTVHCNGAEAATSTYNYSVDKVNNTITVDGNTFRLAEISAIQFKYYSVVSTPAGNQFTVYIFQHN